ncbi:MAG: hypothetical protein HY730_07525 [Candidatus Tectomicrobia bacterium]|uniref:Uncharacterized protein n=1 Tax=Tectimicrobiota bacterium TaxID=2528274 RepID=A0A933LRC7_UNCTE|nr:hypothetical protein [Candidatus Tectomicrobia bacterium]
MRKDEIATLIRYRLDQAAAEHGLDSYDMLCIQTMPEGAESCQFSMWGIGPGGKSNWSDYTRLINEKALMHAAARTKR